MNLSIDKIELPSADKLALEDKWILSKLNSVIREITVNMENYDMGIAAQKIYDFIWNIFCDWYIEISKIRLNGEDAEQKKNVENVLCYVLENILKLLHPFMPFITEEIYQALPVEEGFLMTESWPVYNEEFNFPEVDTMEEIMELIKAVREVRAELKVPNSKKVHVTIVTSAPETYNGAGDYLIRLASASSVEVTSNDLSELGGMVSVATSNAKIYLPVAEMVDIEAEKKRIQAELKKAYKEVDFLSAKLNNQGFMAKAPEKVVAEIRAKEKAARDLVEKLEEMYKAL